MILKRHFKSLILGSLLVLSFLPISQVLASDDVPFDENSYDSLRVENEYKLKVPAELVASVWSYLTERYQGEDSFLLKQNP